jgi:hypothetical protein
VFGGAEQAAGIATETGCHSMRGIGITNFLENGGALEAAQRMAGHAVHFSVAGGWHERSLQILLTRGQPDVLASSTEVTEADVHRFI